MVKDAKLVADAIAHGRHLQTGQRLHVAGRQSPQTAIAQPGFFLHLQHRIQALDTKLMQGQGCGFFNPQHDQVVAQLRTDEELCREIGHGLARCFPQGLLPHQVAHHQPIPHRIAQGHVEVMLGGAWRQLPEREKQVLGHAVEQLTGSEATALRIRVATRCWETELCRRGIGHIW